MENGYHTHSMTDREENKKHVNPFYEPYGTPYDAVPFDRIATSDFYDAFMEGIRRDDEEIDKIVSSKDEPTFENTIATEDLSKGSHYYDLLDRVSTVFSCLLGAETNDELDELAQKITPVLTKHENDVLLNEKLFQKIKHVHDRHRELTAEEQMLLNTCYDGYVRSGALLDEASKQRLRSLTEEGGMLSLTFSQNLLKEEKAFRLRISDEKELDGLPERVVNAAAVTAKDAGEDGWTFTLDYPSYSPFMMFSANRQLRREMYMAHMTEGMHDNEQNNLKICSRLINLRRETAQLLGFKTFADYVMARRMAGSVDKVYKLLGDLIDSYMPTAKTEVADIEDMAKKTEGDDFDLKPWDFAFYSHKLQMERYNVDAEMLRPYFQLNNVIKGVFGLATTLYGITFKENNTIPVYNSDVKTFDVIDSDGKFLALLYTDFFPRKGKQSGAWMTELRGQWITSKGENVRPQVMLVMNFTKPTADKPALLSLGEVETFLHEFGHALHGMFANTRFESLSGTNVWWDFVELPSQFMENYASERDFLKTFAFHYKTGEPIPQELIDRIVRSRNFNAAYGCMRQVSFALLDMAYYTLDKEFKEDIPAFEQKAWKKAKVTESVKGTCMTTQFSHIMAGGYSAGYYSYKWAEVLETDAFSVFKHAGIFNRQTAQRFRDDILSRGGTENPMALYKHFRGQEPNIDALLERDGITKGQKNMKV